MGWGLNYSMSDYITNTAAGDNANEAWYHEAVVKNVFAYNKKEDAVSKGITGSDSTGGLIGEIEGGAIDGCGSVGAVSGA